jgi:hypothetical protein
MAERQLLTLGAVGEHEDSPLSASSRIWSRSPAPNVRRPDWAARVPPFRTRRRTTRGARQRILGDAAARVPHYMSDLQPDDHVIVYAAQISQIREFGRSPRTGRPGSSVMPSTHGSRSSSPAPLRHPHQRVAGRGRRTHDPSSSCREPDGGSRGQPPLVCKARTTRRSQRPTASRRRRAHGT